ncbi:MAG: hypothetical protein J6Y57_10185, partial [Lachnospiraceae bacterium]|nr:hypothetical protein [Lachnospiraceae bacterium]
MKKKIIAALLTGAIVASTLTGCGIKGLFPSTGASQATETSPAYIEPEYPSEAPAAEYPDMEPAEAAVCEAWSEAECGGTYDAYETAKAGCYDTPYYYNA